MTKETDGGLAEERDRRDITRMLVKWRAFKRAINPFRRTLQEKPND